MAYIYLGYVLSRVSYRCSTCPKRYFFFASIFSHSWLSCVSLASSSISSHVVSACRISVLYSTRWLLLQCRQHLQRSSLFLLGCSEPFVMILRIHGSKGMHVYLPEIIPHSLKLFFRCPLTLEEDFLFTSFFHALML